MLLKELRILIKNAIQNSDLKQNVYFVGGCVRDFIRGQNPKDIDLVVNKIYGSKKLSLLLFNYYNGKITSPYKLGNYPIWSIRFLSDICHNGKIFHVKDVVIEIAQTMKQQFKNDNSRQRNVCFSTLQDDVLRRDFSMNSGLINIDTNEIIKISKSFLSDIENKIIRCNNGVDKDKIFSEDPLRILRGCVFHARFGWKIQQQTKRSMIKNGYRLKIISQERITSEINKAFKVRLGAYRLINILDQLNLLQYIFPLIYQQKKIYQWNIDDNGNLIQDVRGIHLQGSSVFCHTLNVLRHTSPGIINSWASLFHDIGKNDKTRQQTQDGRIRFINHQFLGAKIAWRTLHYDYKLDHLTVKKIVFLIENHMLFHKMVDYNDKSLRKFIRQTKDDQTRKYLFDLCNADCLGTLVKYGECIDSNLTHVQIQDRIVKLVEKDKEVSNKILPFNGNQIMEILELKPSKKVGIAKNIILQIVDEYGYQVDKNFAKSLLIQRFNLISTDD